MFARRTAWHDQPNRFTQALDARRRSGQPVFDLSESNPTRCGFDYPHWLLDALPDPRALDYAPEARGLRSAREAVSAYYAARGERADPDRILLATSTSEAYSWIFRLLCDPGDEILVPAPSYPLFEYLASIQDVAPVRYPLFYDHGWHVDLHALEQALTPRTRAIMLVNPNNPTGSYVREAELKGLNRLCAARELALVADEVFLDFAFDQAQHPSLVRNDTALTFTLSGLSKIAGLPQMKVAWLVAGGPAAQVEAALSRLEVIADTYLSLNTPLQLALPALLAFRSEFQAQLGKRMQANLAALDAALQAVPSVVRLEAEGGWYAVLRVPQTASDEDVAIALLEQGVVVHPGHFYDFSAEGYLVVSLLPAPERFAEGAARLAASLRQRFR
jgi:aspartate/methionine/tyrosine aminotransferase